MSNYNMEEMARNMGFNDTYLNKLKATNKYISESANQDRNQINSQLNQTLSDYERERADQNKNFVSEAQNAYRDYAKAINPYSGERSQATRLGLGNSGYSESSLIGANNAYQNRYTNTKTNYDNIFADINNNIAKARETSNIELAKIAQNEQDRLLENLYKLNDEYTAEKQREEEKRRWEAEMALQRQQLAKSSSRSSSSGSSYSFSDGTGTSNSDAYNQILNYAKAGNTIGNKFGVNNDNLIATGLAKQVQLGNITEQEAYNILNNL